MAPASWPDADGEPDLAVRDVLPLDFDPSVGGFPGVARALVDRELDLGRGWVRDVRERQVGLFEASEVEPARR